jgi:hypothetical protein
MYLGYIELHVEYACFLGMRCLNNFVVIFEIFRLFQVLGLDRVTCRICLFSGNEVPE